MCFAFLIAAICMAALVQHPAYLAASVIGAACLNLSMEGTKALKRLARLLPLWALLSAVNPLLNTRGAQVLWTVFGRPYTLEALCYGMVLAGMFAAMIEWFAAYNAILTEDKFSYLFAALAPSTALLLTTVLRMIPNLTRQARQIAGARRCVGMGAEGNAREKLQSGMVILSALTSWALEGSVVTADSMNSRGYGAGKRSCYHTYSFKVSDAMVSAIFVLMLAATVVALAQGGGEANYTPEMVIAPITGENVWGLAAYALFLLLPTLLNLKEDVQWHISRSKI